MQEKSPRSATFATLALLGLGGGMATIFSLIGREPNVKAHVPEFIALSLAAGVLYLVSVYLVERFELSSAALLIILGSALILRLLVLSSSPSLSDDVYRYQWEGRVQRAHLNPYQVFPAMRDLERFQDSRHPLETGRTIPTLYPPLSERAFAWVESIPGYKRLFTAFDLMSLAVLLLIFARLREPPHRVLVYAWNPGVIVSFAMCGHNDSLTILLLLVASLLIIVRRPGLSISILALSFLGKFFPALLLPIFLKRTRWAYAGLFVLVAVLAYLPYLDTGRNLLQGLSDYSAGWEGNDSLFRLARLSGNSKAQAQLVAGVAVFAFVVYALRRGLEPLKASLFLTAAPLLVSPNAFPWYFTWSIPFLCFYSSRPWLLMSVVSVLGYAPVVAYAEGQPYRDSPLILALEYVPVYAWLACNCLAVIRNSKLGK